MQCFTRFVNTLSFLGQPLVYIYIYIYIYIHTTAAKRVKKYQKSIIVKIYYTDKK